MRRAGRAARAALADAADGRRVRRKCATGRRFMVEGNSVPGETNQLYSGGSQLLSE